MYARTTLARTCNILAIGRFSTDDCHPPKKKSIPRRPPRRPSRDATRRRTSTHMTNRIFARVGRLATRSLNSRTATSLAPSYLTVCSAASVSCEPRGPHEATQYQFRKSCTPRFFSTSTRLASPLSPEVLGRIKPAEITDAQYHELSDEYLENLLSKFEAAQDERDTLDVEYSVSPILPTPLRHTVGLTFARSLAS